MLHLKDISIGNNMIASSKLLKILHYKWYLKTAKLHKPIGNYRKWNKPLIALAYNMIIYLLYVQ